MSLGHAGDQRYFDKDQRLVRHARVEKGKAAAVGFEPVLQIGPAADLVHRLVGHQFFEQRRRRLPADPLQLEKADIEPIGEQPLQILLETAQQRVVAAEVNQLGAPIDQELDPFGERVELAQQGNPRRLQRLAQLALGRGALGGPFGLRQGRAAAVDLTAVDVELAGEQPQETLASVGVEQQIGAAEVGRPRPRRDLAAARV